jgi:hypothetical protein
MFMWLENKNIMMFVAFRHKVLEFSLSIIDEKNSKFNLQKTKDIVALKASFHFYFLSSQITSQKLVVLQVVARLCHIWCHTAKLNSFTEGKMDYPHILC